MHHLKESDNFDRQLFLDLCDQINKVESPYFNEAKILSAELRITDDSSGAVSIRECFQKPIISLLEISNSQEAKARQNAFVNAFINNGTVANDELRILSEQNQERHEI